MRHIKLLSLLCCTLTIFSTMTAYAVPNAWNKGKENVNIPATAITVNKKDDVNVTGIEHKDNPAIKTLKDDINAVLPYLQEALQNVYDRTEKELKQEIKDNHWDYEYTMLSFNEYGNPYDNIDYNSLIAAYATVIALGRNNHPLLSDAPLLKTEKEIITDEDGITYAEVKLLMLDADGILSYYGYDPDDETIHEQYETRLKNIEKALRDTDVRQSMFLNSSQDFQEYMALATGYTIPDTLPFNVQRILTIALSLCGRIPYDWGGKPSQPGYDTSWWTYNEETGRQRGLDCSGFVQWVFMTAGYDSATTDKLISTYSIRENLQDISADELQPGDIGLMKNNSEGTNHTGIYLGNGLWIHCSSGAHTVTVGKPGFRYFKRMPEGAVDEDLADASYETAMEDIATDENTAKPADGSDGIELTESEIYTFAQLIEHEVGCEGYNAWVAVAEVVLNRVNCSDFPNTLLEVIYQPRQFSYVSEIINITPRQEVIDVARNVAAGRVKIFNNPNVLFFKNPTITDGIPSTEKVDWGKLPWYQAVGSTAFYLGYY